jgi:Zn-dependent M28 family amino/carboxypeptidase
MVTLLALAAAAAFASPISADRLKADVAVLASDAFAGRGPGEIGETRTVGYIAREFEKAGLTPGGVDGSWFQPVPLVRLDRLPGAKAVLVTGSGRLDLAIGRDMTLGLRSAGSTSVAAAPIVFAGYGVVDRSRGWDAYRGIDMAGKVALVLANDPDFEAGTDLGFQGRRMAYPGRFGAKVEAAARGGAVGVLVIHEEAAASYPFSQVASGDALPAFALAPLAPAPTRFTGWLALGSAQRLLARSGLNLDRLKRQARKPDFRAVPLSGLAISIEGTLKATPITSRNVVGIVGGASRASEYILYGAHWDANGTNGPDARGDAIRNGAIDNGIGTAELIEVARAFGKAARPSRSVVFAAWTAEEKGLLGAEYYAAYPLYPLARTAAVINLDPHVALPRTRNLELIGGGRTTLEGDLARVARAQGLAVTDEPNPEAGWYYRSDHYALAKKGVPALAFRAGRDLQQGGTPAGSAIVNAYNARCYHQPCDEADPRWTMEAAAQEASVAYALGRELANSHTWPGWNPGVEFGVIRQASVAER